MAIKKSDLYGSLWRSCDALRGGMDASQYKDYVLTLLFLKYVSDKAEAEDSLIEVPEGCSFSDIVALKSTKEIGEGIDKIISEIGNANNDLRGVIDVTYFNDPDKLGKGKDMVDRLTELVGIFEDLDFSASRADGDDLLGDAYEYLMRHFATESGKSKGQFYTPAEVSRILARVVGIGEDAKRTQTIYDPTCGSGSLLLKAAAQAPRGLTIYGQEMDVSTSALAKMNMILHGNATALIYHGNVISDPGFTSDGKLKRHDFVVANPPFSNKVWSSGISPDDDQYGRFKPFSPPEKNGDYAFLLHAISSLKPTGRAAVILPHGVLFRGNDEAKIRRELIEQGLIKGVIGLPANLFYGTGIPACIVVIDREGAEQREAVFLVDASKGFRKDGAKNRLREQDIHKIVDVFESEAEIEGFSRRVPKDEIASEANDYNLNLPRYIDSSEPEDLQDLDAHLNGGIPNHDLDLLGDYWEAFPSLREQLFEVERPGYSKARVSSSEVREAIDANADVQNFSIAVEKQVSEWWEFHKETLEGIDKGTLPGSIITELSEDLLDRLRGFALLDPYDIYEQLMIYWTETMQDDIYLVSAEGWFEAAQPRPLREIGKTDKGKPKYEEADLSFGNGKTAMKYKMDLLPPEIIVETFFTEEEGARLKRDEELAVATQALEEFAQEHGSEEDSPLAAVTDEKGTVQSTELNNQIAGLEDLLRQAIVTRHFPEEGQLFKDQQEALEEATSKREKYVQEDLANDGPLTQIANNKNKVTQKDLKASISELEASSSASSTAEVKILERCLALIQEESKAKSALSKTLKALDLTITDSGIDPASVSSGIAEDLEVSLRCRELIGRVDQAKKALKEAEVKLGELVVSKYSDLDEEEVRALVLDAKWRYSLMSHFEGVVARSKHSLISRVAQLESRYALTLGDIDSELQSLQEEVSGYLSQIGRS